MDRDHIVADAVCVGSAGDGVCLFLPPFEKSNRKDKIFTVRLTVSTGNNFRMSF